MSICHITYADYEMNWNTDLARVKFQQGGSKPQIFIFFK